MDNSLLEMLKIGGPAAVIVALFLWFLDRNEKRTTTLIENHLRHSTEAITALTVELGKISSNQVNMMSVLDRNTKAYKEVLTAIKGNKK